jgi:hypothetical protein
MQGQKQKFVNNIFYFLQPICTDDAILSFSLSTQNIPHEHNNTSNVLHILAMKSEFDR